MRGLNMEIVLLAGLFLVVLAVLVGVEYWAGASKTTEALITWGSMIIAAVVAIVRGSSKPPQQ